MSESIAFKKSEILYAVKLENGNFFILNFKNGRSLQFPMDLWSSVANQFSKIEPKSPMMINFEHLIVCHRIGNDINMHFEDCFRCVNHPESELIWGYICRSI